MEHNNEQHVSAGSGKNCAAQKACSTNVSGETPRRNKHRLGIPASKEKNGPGAGASCASGPSHLENAPEATEGVRCNLITSDLVPLTCFAHFRGPVTHFCPAENCWIFCFIPPSRP
jgi:hypothetical protein